MHFITQSSAGKCVVYARCDDILIDLRRLQQLSPTDEIWQSTVALKLGRHLF